MLFLIPAPVRGSVGLLFAALNTSFWSLFLFLFVPVKVLIPIPAMRRWATRQMVRIAENWISVNSWAMKILADIRWKVDGLEDLHPEQSYLVCANHQSWVDVLLLQKIFNRRIPFFRFFLKQELIWVPLLGAAWWALDYPFMKRYSKEYLEKNPGKRGTDLETTRRACERFRGSPISVLNFLEGTRFTPEKHAKTKSPYKNLLPPKTGGLAFVLDCMGPQFREFLDVTIVYPQGPVGMWGLFTGKLREVRVHVEHVQIPPELLSGDYLKDEVFRDRIQNWIRDLWQRKDRRIDEMKK